MEWAPVIVTLIATLGGACTYLWQKHVDQGNDLLRQKRTAYINLLVSLNRHLTERNLDNLSKLNQSRAELFLVASDDVAKSVGSFFTEKRLAKLEEAETGDVSNPDTLLDYYAEMTLAMRQDCFEKSKFEINDARDCMPIAFSNEDDRMIVR